MSRSIKTVKCIIMRKNQTLRYEYLLFDIIGQQLTKLSCYDATDSLDDYFNPDVDYMMIIRPIGRKKK